MPSGERPATRAHDQGQAPQAHSRLDVSPSRVSDDRHARVVRGLSAPGPENHSPLVSEVARPQAILSVQSTELPRITPFRIRLSCKWWTAVRQQETERTAGSRQKPSRPRPLRRRAAGGCSHGRVCFQVDSEFSRMTNGGGGLPKTSCSEHAPEGLLAAMTGAGFPIMHEAREGPNWTRNAEPLSPRLRPDSEIDSRSATGCSATYRKLNRLHPRVRRGSTAATSSRRDDFLRDYYTTNRPVIITGMMDDWPAMRKWNLDFFPDQFGDREVEVQMGRNAGDANYEIEREKFIQTIQFARLRRARSGTAGDTNDFYLTANNNSTTRRPCPSSGTTSCRSPNTSTAGPARAASSGWARPAPSPRSTTT